MPRRSYPTDNPGGGIPSFVPGLGQYVTQFNQAPYSNIAKKFNNMNYCFYCGLDVEDWHTSKMCCMKIGAPTIRRQPLDPMLSSTLTMGMMPSPNPSTRRFFLGCSDGVGRSKQ
jgi:hypothetical protein